MYISKVMIEGFRNFKSSVINFNEKTLVIGANDIGKSNLIYALRLILDKTISQLELEPKDSDFYVHDNINEFKIIIKFKDVIEDCVKSRLGKYTSENNELYLAYRGLRKETGELNYFIQAGHSLEDMQDFETRFYLKVLNMDYIESSRMLNSFIKKEKKNLFHDTKIYREDSLISLDDKETEKIKKSINILNQRVSRLSYINTATENLNKEMQELSHHHVNNYITFDAGGTNVTDFINNLNMVSKVNDKSLDVGGDGRNNQIYLALRTSKNRILEEVPLQVTICCIEEPEAHLHPHQQRSLASYLVNNIHGQVIITSHSPQIASEFSPNSIIKLYTYELSTLAADDGCSEKISESLVEFGHRLNILPAEAFFSNIVFLVEGVSEVLFYKALALEVGIELDRHNISILAVDGVGFDVYLNLFNKFNIQCVIRTDNDVFKVPHKEYYYMSGIKRSLKLCKTYNVLTDDEYELLDKEHNLSTIVDRFKFSETEKVLFKEYNVLLEKYNFFLSEVDLESDLIMSDLKNDILEYYNESDATNALNLMKESKGRNMFNFLNNIQPSLSVLNNHVICNPLKRCEELARGFYGTN